MQSSRRVFLRHIAGLLSVVIGGAPLVGCLGETWSGVSTSQQPVPPEATSSGFSSDTAASSGQPAPSAPSAPNQQPLNASPVWQPSPTIEFVEGVPSVVSVRQFVQDPNQDPLVIQLKSGSLIPGITWNPSDATIAYDGRPLGAKPDQAVVVSGLTFSADDNKK